MSGASDHGREFKLNLNIQNKLTAMETCARVLVVNWEGGRRIRNKPSDAMSPRLRD
jgi:hypothetical protein